MGYQVVEIRFDDETGKFVNVGGYSEVYATQGEAEEVFIEVHQDFRYDCWGIVNVATGILEDVESSIVGMDDYDKAYGVEAGHYSERKEDIIEVLVATHPGRKVWDSDEDRAAFDA